jgi:hypothetical protein
MTDCVIDGRNNKRPMIREKISNPQLSHNCAKLMLLKLKGRSQMACLSFQAIPFGEQFSVRQPCLCGGWSVRLLFDLTDGHQEPWTNPWKVQPLGIGDTGHLSNGGAAPIKLRQNCISHTWWKLPNREQSVQLHRTPTVD